MPAKRVCATVGCPHLIDRDQRRCPACAAKYEKQRGTRQARGYDQTHVDLRAQWAPIVTTGTVHCARCHQLINPHELWSLDHDDKAFFFCGCCCSCCLASFSLALPRFTFNDLAANFFEIADRC